jgi:hypothetical protein
MEEIRSFRGGSHCKHGHEFRPETTRVYVSASTGERRRHCLVCEKRRNDARPGTAEQLATLAQLVAAAGGAR